MSKSINWSEYNKSLINRGRITFWFDKSVTNSWQTAANAKVGEPQIYSDTAIESLSISRFRFELNLRSNQGFAESLVAMMGLPIDVPDYTTLSRRLEKMSAKIFKKFMQQSPFDDYFFSGDYRGFQP